MPYLALTAAEFRRCPALPEKCAWMACHFSPYGTGLTNLPKALPEGSLLILNDRTPVRGHDPRQILDTLRQAVEEFRCAGVLLDLQRPGCPDTAAIAKTLLALPCPVCVSEMYAQGLECPVFLPPVPLLRTVEEYIAGWKGREIWLEAARNGAVITVTAEGSRVSPLPVDAEIELPHYDGTLFCHYRILPFSDKAVFTLRRTESDLDALLEKAASLGITNTVGLWQELK